MKWNVIFAPELLSPFDVRHVPLPPPEVGIFDTPLVCVRINTEWMSHISGMIERLIYRDAWLGSDHDIDRAVGEIQQFFAALGVGGSLKERCAEYPASNLRITYEPNDPFLTPDYTPPSYLVPPWYCNALIPLPNVLPGDAMVNFAGMPAGVPWIDLDLAGLLEAGLPRFRLNGIQGNKTVELHFVTTPQGGNALITIDGNPIPLLTVELNADITAIPIPELPWVTVHEIEVTGEGMHFIDVTFIPILNNETGLPVFFGGGLRKVVICGLTPECEDDSMPLDVRQNEESPCILEKSDDGVTWETFANLRLCPPMIRVVHNTGGQPDTTEVSTDDGETWTPVESTPPPITPREGGTEDENRCLASANAAVSIQAGYEEVRLKYGTTANVLILASAAITIWGFFFIFAPVIAIVLPIIAAMIAVGGFGAAELTEDDLEVIQCILYCNSSISEGVVTFDFDQVVIEMQAHAFLPVQIAGIMLPLLGADGLNRAGATTSITEAECADCDCDNICPIWNFDGSATGWGYDPEQGLGAFVQTGTGLRVEHDFFGDFAGGDRTALTVPVGCTLTGINFTTTGTMGYSPSGHIEAYLGTSRGESGALVLNTADVAAGIHSYSRTIVGSGQTIYFGLGAIDNNTLARITRAEVEYTGIKPIFSGGTPC